MPSPVGHPKARVTHTHTHKREERETETDRQTEPKGTHQLLEPEPKPRLVVLR